MTQQFQGASIRMKKINFLPRCRKQTMDSISFASTLMLVNESTPTIEFSIQRRLWQKDPHAPFMASMQMKITKFICGLSSCFPQSFHVGIISTTESMINFFMRWGQ